MHVSAADKLARPLAVVCHDAGAANIIFADLENAGDRLSVHVQGPAVQLAARGLPPSVIVSSLEEALSGAATLLSGTGWSSDLEHRARIMARQRGIPSVAVLDHWVNYPDRFRRDGEEVLPDRIWVTDCYAEAEALRHFDARKIERVRNVYVEKQLSRITPDAPSNGRLLYVLEPARTDWGRTGAGEFQALDYFVVKLPELGLPANLSIWLRPHPSDPPKKYDSWVSAHSDLALFMDQSVDMAQAINDAQWVAGCESFGLVLALEAGRKTFCTLPPWAPDCRLPYQGLVHVKATSSHQ